MSRLRSKDIARAADLAVIAASSAFAVNWFIGRAPDDGGVITRSSLWRRANFTAADYGDDRSLALAAARFAVVEAGCDEHGRIGLVYCITSSGLTIHVE